jgi:hypothetical protein
MALKRAISTSSRLLRRNRKGDLKLQEDAFCFRHSHRSNLLFVVPVFANVSDLYVTAFQPGYTLDRLSLLVARRANYQAFEVYITVVSRHGVQLRYERSGAGKVLEVIRKALPCPCLNAFEGRCRHRHAVNIRVAELCSSLPECDEMLE